MRDGVALIFQALLFDGRWQGRIDFLRRVEIPSALGGRAYEVVDTKLARRVKPSVVHQLSPVHAAGRAHPGRRDRAGGGAGSATAPEEHGRRSALCRALHAASRARSSSSCAAGRRTYPEPDDALRPLPPRAASASRRSCAATTPSARGGRQPQASAAPGRRPASKTLPAPRRLDRRSRWRASPRAVRRSALAGGSCRRRVGRHGRAASTATSCAARERGLRALAGQPPGTSSSTSRATCTSATDGHRVPLGRGRRPTARTPRWAPRRRRGDAALEPLHARGRRTAASVSGSSRLPLRRARGDRS